MQTADVGTLVTTLVSKELFSTSRFSLCKILLWTDFNKMAWIQGLVCLGIFLGVKGTILVSGKSLPTVMSIFFSKVT